MSFQKESYQAVEGSNERCVDYHNPVTRSDRPFRPVYNHRFRKQIKYEKNKKTKKTKWLLTLLNIHW